MTGRPAVPGVGSWPARRARSTPDAVATVHDGARRTYRELHERVGALRGALAARLGVAAGDRVAYLGPNHPAFLETLFAVVGLGAVFVPLNTRLAVDELAAVLDDAAVDLLVHDAGLADAAAALTARRAGLATVDVGGAYEALLAEAAGDDPGETPVGPDVDAVLLYTSGTTGRAKGVRLTHGNLTWNAFSVVVDVDLTSEEVCLVAAPLFHSAALGMTTLPTLLKGGTVVLEPGFDVERTLDLVERERVTLAFGVPTMFDALTRSPRWDTADLSSLRFLLCGGAPVPVDLLERYRGRGLTFLQGYGMTEAAPHVLLLPAAASRSHLGSAGRPAFFSDVRLDHDLPGDPGELLVRGPNVSPGYLDRPDDTAGAFTDDGWFRSGDVATVDDAGFYRIVDRAKDMFISGGENVYPAEVESVLRRHPAVDDAAVVGVPDPRWGEVGHALVVAGHDTGVDAEALREHVGAHLARFKVPRHVSVVPELPRGASGKLDKVALRRVDVPEGDPAG